MAFVLFAADGRISGSDLYARRLAATLGAQIVPVAVSVDGLDEEAFASARAAWQALAPGARLLVSGQVLPAFVPIAGLSAMPRAAILMDAPEVSGKEMRASSSLVVTSSEAAAEAIANAWALPRERIAVIEPPTPALPRAAGSGSPAAAIVTPGASATEEACTVLFQALAGLPDLDWRLRIAGPAAEQTAGSAALATLCERFGLAGRVDCSMPTSAADDEILWRESDLFASAAVERGYGFATAAAMKRGLPVVIAGCAKSAPAIVPEAGAVAPPGDHAQLAKALRRMIFDRELRASMAEAAWQAGQKLPTDRDVRERLLAALG